MTRVLFVCLGNICRSPTAEGVFRAQAARAGLEVQVDSCGTSDWHVGEPPYGPAIAAAAARGVDLSALRARQFVPEDFDRFDIILAMDARNLAAIESCRPAGVQTTARLFLDYAPQSGRRDVPDPYYSRDFDEALDLITAASRGLAAALAQDHPAQ